MKIHQFRCQPSAAKDNGYNNIDTKQMFSGNNILHVDVNKKNTYLHISQLGIQGAPGTKFWLNNSQYSSNPNAQKGIVLNWTGIFEIDLSDMGGEINSIIFDPASENLYLGNTIDEGIEPTNYKLVVDILYDNGGVQ